MQYSLSERVVIVTGANGGIGAATAKILARDGAHLVRPKNPRPKGVVVNGWLFNRDIFPLSALRTGPSAGDDGDGGVKR